MTTRFRATFFVCLVSILAGAPRLGAAVPFTLDFANGTDGKAANGIWTSAFSFVNLAPNDNSCNLNIIGQDGNPLVVGMKQVGTGNSFPFSMPPGGAQEFDTDGGGGGGGLAENFRASVICTAPVTGGVTYTFSVDGQPATTVGVLNQSPFNVLVSPANSSTAIALANPNAISALTANVTLYNPNGSSVGTAVVTAPPNGQTAFNLNSIPGLTKNFQAGSVQITGNQPFEGLAIGVQTIPGNATNPAGGFVVSNTPSISYEQFDPSYSGTLTFTFGSLSGTTETITLTNIVPTGTGTYVGTMNITSSNGTSSGTVNLEVIPATSNTGFSLTLQGQIGPWDSNTTGKLDLESNGSFTGSFIDASIPLGGNITLNPINPAPTITTISPNSAVAGGAAFTLTINGTNFVAASMVNFGGAAPATTFVNSTQLTAAIPASSIASTGILAVTVTNPASGGGTSNAMNFTITGGGASSVPTITSLFPSCVPAGELFVNPGDAEDEEQGANNQLQVGGLNFVANSVVRWNGADRPTTLFSNSGGTILTAQISAGDIAAAGTAAVTVFNPPPGGGSSNSMTFTITPGGVDPQSIAVDSAGKFAYVANSGGNCAADGYVSMYTINPTTGALASIGPPVSSQDVDSDSVTIDPFGKFVYVASTGAFATDGSVAMYAINAKTGALTSIGAIIGNCPGFCTPLSVAVDPSGKFAYVTTGGGIVPNNIAMYTINATTGALTSIGTIAVGGFADWVAVDPFGRFAYAATANYTLGSAGDVSMYTINATAGALTFIGTVAAGTNPISMVVDPSGRFAYEAAASYTAPGSAGNVSMYTIDATTGALTFIGTIATGTLPTSIAIHPSGKFAYVTNSGSSDVSMYTINTTTGTLTSIGTEAAGSAPTSIAIHPSGKFAYVTNSTSNDVSMYSIDAATGALTLIGTIGT